MSTGAIDKPKTKAHKRYLENREAKLVENDKTCLFLRGGNSSDAVTKVMSTLFSFKKPDAVQFHQKNMLRPFEDTTSLDFFSQRNDTAQFVFGSHSKKRPHNMIFGRFFNHQLLDMVEVGVFYANISNKLKLPSEIKPILSFTGQGWTEKPELERMRNILTDIFSGQRAENVALKGLELLFNFEVMPDLQKVKLTTYKVKLKKSGTKVPRVELDAGEHPDDLTIEFVIRRHHMASSDQWKKSMKRPAAAALGHVPPKKPKNKEFDDPGHQYGRVHMQKQDFDKLELARLKALKKALPKEEEKND